MEVHGTLAARHAYDLPVVQRALLHSLEMAQEDTAKWCGGLDDREVHARPFQLPSVAFQLRHIARSLDRFCCYAEGTPLNQQQLAALASEMDSNGTRESIFSELEESLEKHPPASRRDRPPAA